VSAAVLAMLTQVTTRALGVETQGHWGPGFVAFGDERAATFAVSSACVVSAALAAWVFWRDARRRAGAWRWRAATAGLIGALQTVLLTTTVAAAIVHREALRGVARVVTRSDYRCVVRANGDAACWGANYFEELGDGTTRLRQHPVVVRELHDVADLQPPCARLGSGEVRCWGAMPGLARVVANLPRARLSSAGCIVSVDDEVLCWYDDAILRVPVNAAGALDLWGWSDRGCVRRPDTIACWARQGWNDPGRWSDPRRDPIVALSPCPAPTDNAVPIAGTAGPFSVYRDWDYARDHDGPHTPHYMEVTSAGRVRAWRLPGRDDETCGQPFDIPGLEEVRAVVSSALSPGLLLRPDGTLHRWTFRSGVARVEAPFLDHVVDIDRDGTCAVRDDGTVWCWGPNDFGQVGDGTREEREAPTLVRR
jgi:hypothetical protein